GPLARELPRPVEGQQLTTGGRFDRHFTVYAPPGYGLEAMYVLTPVVMAALIDHAGSTTSRSPVTPWCSSPRCSPTSPSRSHGSQCTLCCRRWCPQWCGRRSVTGTSGGQGSDPRSAGNRAG